MSDITLTVAQQDTLSSLRDSAALAARTTDRLNTGKKVNGVADDAVAYFRSQSLSDRASALDTRKANIDQSIQAIQAALDGTSAVEGLLSQLKGITEAARGAPLSQRVAATKQFTSVSQQLAQLINDTSYQGLNLLTSTGATLTTQFSERTAATLVVNGFALLGAPQLLSGAGSLDAGLFPLQPGSVAPGHSGYTVPGQPGYLPPIGKDGYVNFYAFNSVIINISATVFIPSPAVQPTNERDNPIVGGFSNLDVDGLAAANGAFNGSIEYIPATLSADIYASIDRNIDGAISNIQAVSSSLGINVAILQARATFTSSYSTTLQGASDKLTLADLNEEAANSQALALRQQVGIQSLAVSGQQNQSILDLLK